MGAVNRVAEPPNSRSTPATMANVGSLSRIALPEVLKTIALNEHSGCLEVTAGQHVRTVYFDRGFIVFTASNSKKDRLGQLLLDAGRLTEAELEIAAKLMKGNRRIGEAIVAAGYLTEDELGRALANQARKVCRSLFSLSEGMYRFQQQECPIPLELRLSLSLYRIQLEGIREMRNGKLIGANLPSRKCKLRLSKFPPFSFEDVRFVAVELLVMEATQSERTLEAIVQRARKPQGVVLRAVYGLLSAGILERADRAPEKPLKVQEELGTFLLSKLDHDTGSTKASNVRQEVLLEFENSARASASDLLQVGDDASLEEIEKAYQARRTGWEAKQKSLDNERTLCLKVEEIQERLARAKAELLAKKGGEDSSSAPVAPAEAPSPPKATNGKATNAEVKRLLKEIKLRRMVQDNEGVISFLYELVAVDPENAKYEAMLAQALGAHPVMKGKAERHFRRSLSLDPQNAEVHYLFGRYYQSFDMKARALAEFKSALTIDPALSKARSAVVEIKGSVEGSLHEKLKRLFV